MRSVQISGNSTTSSILRNIIRDGLQIINNKGPEAQIPCFVLDALAQALQQGRLVL